MLSLIIIIVLSYLVGSIPTSVWVGKITKGIDIRLEALHELLDEGTLDPE